MITAANLDDGIPCVPLRLMGLVGLLGQKLSEVLIKILKCIYWISSGT